MDLIQLLILFMSYGKIWHGDYREVNLDDYNPKSHKNYKKYGYIQWKKKD